MNYEQRPRYRVVKNEHGHFDIWYGEYPVAVRERAYVTRADALRRVLSEAVESQEDAPLPEQEGSS